MDDLSPFYLPAAIGLGALHALEPGHAKTLTAAYLVGINGRARDAVALGLAAALTHSAVVVLLAGMAVLAGREALGEQAGWWLQVGSGGLVVALGLWLLARRLLVRQVHHQLHADDDVDHQQHHHDHPDDDAHAAAHARALPAYVGSGQRPGLVQIAAFGAAGGLVPCPASVSVMLLALAVGSPLNGLLLVLGFSIGLAAALVGVGVIVVWGVRRLGRHDRLAWLSRHAATISAALVILSGLAAIVAALAGGVRH